MQGAAGCRLLDLSCDVRDAAVKTSMPQCTAKATLERIATFYNLHHLVVHGPAELPQVLLRGVHQDDGDGDQDGYNHEEGIKLVSTSSFVI